MRRFAIPLAVGALAAAGIAFAQPASGGGDYRGQPYPQAPARDGQDRNGYDQGYDEDDRTSPPGGVPGYGGADYSGVDAGAPDLGRDLALRADQQAALRAYQQATTPSAAEQARMAAQARSLAAMTTPQRLDAIASQMRRDEADFASRAAAVRRFYAQLTPAQQRRFDQLTGPGSGGDQGQGDDGDVATGAMPR